MIGLKITLDTAKLQSALGRKAAAIHDDAVEFVWELADAAADLMRSTVPVETGALRDSIKVTLLDNGARIEAGTDHAWFIEYGTLHTPAQPFFRPAVAEMRADLERQLANAIKRKVS